ncbi:hypothetical protein HanPI659440_Chr05g0205031 [Helianthus annuus]|nr:hypothetical protein HanPI659440_Chr05g0205031 [Helianthus annuus]
MSKLCKSWNSLPGFRWVWGQFKKKKTIKKPQARFELVMSALEGDNLPIAPFINFPNGFIPKCYLWVHPLLFNSISINNLKLRWFM